MSNITEIKTKLGIATLNLNYATDKATGQRAVEADGKPTGWLRHWDNDNRVAVSIHEDTVAKIKAGQAETLGLQTETKSGSQGEYTAHRIVLFSAPDMSL